MHDLDLQLNQAHRQDLLRAAEHDRLLAAASANRPGTADRAALAAGDLLVGTGQRLEQWARRRRLRRARTHLHAI